MTQVSQATAESKKSLARQGPAKKTWNHLVIDDADAAAEYLNLDPAQTAGEAILTTRPDGKLDLVVLL